MVATALLDRLLHHATVIQIRGSELSTSRACRSRVGKHLVEKSRPTVADPANSQTSRPAAQKRSSRSTRRLITSPAKTGEFYFAIIGEIPRAITLVSAGTVGPSSSGASATRQEHFNGEDDGNAGAFSTGRAWLLRRETPEVFMLSFNGFGESPGGPVATVENSALFVKLSLAIATATGYKILVVIISHFSNEERISQCSLVCCLEAFWEWRS